MCQAHVQGSKPMPMGDLAFAALLPTPPPQKKNERKLNVEKGFS